MDKATRNFFNFWRTSPAVDDRQPHEDCFFLTYISLFTLRIGLSNQVLPIQVYLETRFRQYLGD
ncbi:MAG: hypothetical protein DMG58_28015 [Acidobacteria bacterium]|nr:MAG: hypothetical protein DMG58_28015 [Acidobacteriota bacterium]